MANNITFTEALMAAGSLAMALMGLAYAFQKFMTGWKSTGTENNMLTMLHNELGRMSEQNTKLMSELEKLQTEVLKLNGELYKLTRENQTLHSEVSRLTSEVSRLQRLMPGTTYVVAN